MAGATQVLEAPYTVRPLATVGQGPSGPDWLAIALGVWSGQALATDTAWTGLCLIHHHHRHPGLGCERGAASLPPVAIAVPSASWDRRATTPRTTDLRPRSSVGRRDSLLGGVGTHQILGGGGALERKQASDRIRIAGPVVIQFSSQL